VLCKTEWVYCPLCGNKTHNRIREDTVLKNYPLYCPCFIPYKFRFYDLKCRFCHCIIIWASFMAQGALYMKCFQ